MAKIYKQKEEDKDFILYVDYYQTKQKLSPKHIIIYLANTNFKAGFTFLDEELITEYIKSDFMIDCPILVRMVSIIVRMRLHYDINGAEKKLTILFPEEKIHQFIEENIELVDELIETIRDSVPWAMVNLHENLTDEAKKEEKGKSTDKAKSASAPKAASKPAAKGEAKAEAKPDKKTPAKEATKKSV